MKTNHRAGAAGKGRRMPDSIRFHDTEWNRIKACAEARVLVPSEFVRHATLTALADGYCGPDTRLAPLIETIFRATQILVSRLREEMLAAGE